MAILNDTSLNLDNFIKPNKDSSEAKSSKRRKLNEDQLPSSDDFDLERALYHVHLDLSKEKEASRRASLLLSSSQAKKALRDDEEEKGKASKITNQESLIRQSLNPAEYPVQGCHYC